MQREPGDPVECRAEASYPGRPLALTYQGQSWVVAEVLKSWRSPQGVGFRVSTDDGKIFDLLYDEACDKWSVREL